MKRYSARQLPHLEAAKHALLQGFEAFLVGASISDNAHDSHRCPAAYTAWRAGWLEAEEALRAAQSAADGGDQPTPAVSPVSDPSTAEARRSQPQPGP